MSTAIAKLEPVVTPGGVVRFQADSVQGAKAALEELEATASYLEERVQVLPLETLADEEVAADVLREIRRVKGQAEDSRKALVGPAKSALGAVDKVFRTHRKVLEDVERQIRAKMAEAAQRKRAHQEALQRQAIEAAKAQDLETANAALAAAGAADEGSPEGTSFRWDWEVASVDMSKLPREYLMVDMAKVKLEIKAAAAEGRDPSIPGVTFDKKATPIVRSK